MYPTQLRKPQKRRRSHRTPVLILLFIMVASGGYTAYTISQPFARLEPTVSRTNLDVTTPAGNYPWPNYGQGAFGLADGTVVDSFGEQKPVPIASVSKVILALAILQKYPIAAGASGPTYTITEADVASYRQYIAMRGSVMPVAVGQKLTLKQMLQGIMLPSANNIADTLAIWGFGSIAEYHTYANTFLQQNGLAQTKVGGDASGYSNESVSTARDLIKLGALVMKDVTLAEIANQKVATIPGTGLITNYNNLLGSNNVSGIKTGNNDGNGGVFLGSAKVNVNGKTVTVISALSGATTLGQVLRDSGVLLSVAKNQFTTTTIVKKGDILASYRQSDNSLLQAVAANDVTVTALAGSSVRAKVNAESISYENKVGQTVGAITIPATEFTTAQSTPIVLKQAPTKPDLLYRLLHP